jgi:hypothetical protein
MSSQTDEFLTTDVINVNIADNNNRRKIGMYWFLTWFLRKKSGKRTLEKVATILKEYCNIANFIIQMEQCLITSESHIHMAITLKDTSHRPVPFFAKSFPDVHIQYAHNIDAVRLYCCKPYTRQLPPLFFDKNGLSVDKCLDEEQYLKRAEDFKDEKTTNIKQNSIQCKIARAREKAIEKAQIKIAIADIDEETKYYISEKKRYTKLIDDLETKLDVEPGKKSKLNRQDRALAVSQKANYEKRLLELAEFQPVASISHNPSDKIRELENKILSQGDEIITLNNRITQLELLFTNFKPSTSALLQEEIKIEDMDIEPNTPTPPHLKHRDLSPKSAHTLAGVKYKEARKKGLSHNDAMKISSAITNGTEVPSFSPTSPPIKKRISVHK